MTKLRKFRKFGTVGAALLTMLAVSPQAADAGVNGQQVRACDDTGLWYAVRVSGRDIKGRPLQTTHQLDDDTDCYSFRGKWFVGNITLTWLKENSSRRGTSTCYAARGEETDNWVVCIYEPRLA